MSKRNSADTEEGIDYEVGDITKCFHCGQYIVAVEVIDDWDYECDYGSDEQKITEFKTMSWRHYGTSLGSCAEGKTGCYPNADLEIIGKAELCSKCNEYMPECTCCEEMGHDDSDLE